MSTFKDAFDAALARQAQLQGRELNPFYQQIGDAVFAHCHHAMSPAAAGRWTVVSAQTGCGKTNAAMATAVALIETDPNASVTFFVETMRSADRLFREVRALLQCPADCTAGCDVEGCMKREVMTYTTAHSRGNARLSREELKQKAQMQGWNFVPGVFFRDTSIPTARIAIGTHNAWLERKWRGRAFLEYRGQPRSLVIIDEAPDLARLIEKTPSQITELRETILQFDMKQAETDAGHASRQALLKVLTRIDGAMAKAFSSNGPTYDAGTGELLSPAEGEAFSEAHIRMRDIRAWAKAAGARTSAEISSRAAELEGTLRFLEIAGKGYVFLSRQPPRKYLAYQMRVDPPPGAVILDATADISGYAVLGPDMHLPEMPPVSYSRMQTFWIEMPAAYRSPAKIKDTGMALAEPYAEWILGTLKKHTEPGDKVLAVVHKDLLKWRLLPSSPDLGASMPWLPEGCEPGEERTLWTAYFGNGIGENCWKEATKVFLFGEFFLPQSVIVGQTLAYTRKRAGDVDLSGAGRWAKGDFLTALEGHLLRWEKQLVTRGAVRDFDAYGVCGHGVVYKATDGQRLKHHQRLYPGSPAPVPVVDTSVPRRGRAGLVQLLLRHDGEELGAELIEERTGIKPKHLGREVRAEPVMQAMALAHWVFVPGSSRWQKASFRRKEAEDYGLDAAD